IGALPAFAMSLHHSGAGGRGAGRRCQHNTAYLRCGSGARLGGVAETIAFVSSVTKRFRGRSPTTAQDNDFRRSAVLPGGYRQLAAVRRDDLHRALHDERPVRFRSDTGLLAHTPTITTSHSPGRCCIGARLTYRRQMHKLHGDLECCARVEGGTARPTSPARTSRSLFFGGGNAPPNGRVC